MEYYHIMYILCLLYNFVQQVPYIIYIYKHKYQSTLLLEYYK
jgi:hypothetical protein